MAKRRKPAICHRSPVAPPSRPMDRKGWRRSDEKKKLRRELREEGA